MKNIIIFFFIWLVVVNLLALVANNRLNLKPDTAMTWIQTKQQQDWDVVALHNRWDSYWYLDIAQNGYTYHKGTQLSNVVFFPLYPMLVGGIGMLTGNYVLSGWQVSIAFLFLSVLYLYKLAKEFHPEADPLLAVFLMLIFPTAFFFNAVYTESMFLFFSLGLFYYAKKRKYPLAGLFGMLAALTRFSGILLFIPLLIVSFWSGIDHDRTSRGSYRSVALRSRMTFIKIFSPFLVPLGTLLFFVYYQVQFNNFFLYFTEQKVWGRGFSWSQLFNIHTNPAITNLGLDFFFIIFTLIATLFVHKKFGLAYSLYMLTSLIVPLSSGTTMSIGRYILVLFPIYLLGATIKDKLYQNIWILISTLLLALYTTMLAGQYFAG